MARQITYSIATEFRNGFYNPTFNWGRIHAYLNFLGRYWDIQYVRVTGPGRVQINQGAANPGNGIMATTGGWITRISPVANFARSDYVCAKVTMHEGGHWVNLAHSSNPAALMSPRAGTGHNLTASDYPYWPYAWKSALRPHGEPEKLLQTFPHSAPKALADDMVPNWEEYFALRTLHELDPEVNFGTPDPIVFKCPNHGMFSGLLSRFMKP
jgi:hypothetical protein